ncbi:hypothetical protein NDU88_002429 [Pleurodeles waltl]|uniref:Uncharacterized protein n=1 Tax=Pleurodeles waltl TaxID=8319 RepID=A0AAV7KS37_PLEWA|nr:hypothetical protein NDU88_002429 [Pleurodeles waltl]
MKKGKGVKGVCHCGPGAPRAPERQQGERAGRTRRKAGSPRQVARTIGGKPDSLGRVARVRQHASAGLRACGVEVAVQRINMQHVVGDRAGPED